MKTTLHHCVLLYNQQLLQSALNSKTPLPAMKAWHMLKPELFTRQPYFLPGCDSAMVATHRCARPFLNTQPTATT